MERTIEMTLEWKFQVEYNKESPEFKAALESYLGMIDPKGDIEGMINHVIWNVAYRGQQDVEGVGHVTKNGQRGFNPQFGDSGINLIPIYIEEADFTSFTDF